MGWCWLIINRNRSYKLCWVVLAFIFPSLRSRHTVGVRHLSSNGKCWMEALGSGRGRGRSRNEHVAGLTQISEVMQLERMSFDTRSPQRRRGVRIVAYYGNLTVSKSLASLLAWEASSRWKSKYSIFFCKTSCQLVSFDSWNPIRRAQEAWREKVFMLCSEDFWLLFPYFRTLYHKMTPIRKKSIEPLLRYGNPDSQNLATLKNKIHIHRFLSFLSNNSGSDFMFRVAICFWITKSDHIWDPWK